MEQWMCIGIIFNRFVKGVRYQLVIVANADLICHNPSVTQVEDST